MEFSLLKNLSVIILAAGKGKRMHNPNSAKVMALLAGKPLIQHVLENVNDIVNDNIFVVVGHCREEVIDFINKWNYKVKFINQDEQLGTGHAVRLAEPYFKNFSGDILILCGDVPNLSSETLNKFIKNHL